MDAFDKKMAEAASKTEVLRRAWAEQAAYLEAGERLRTERSDLERTETAVAAALAALPAEAMEFFRRVVVQQSQSRQKLQKIEFDPGTPDRHPALYEAGLIGRTANKRWAVNLTALGVSAAEFMTNSNFFQLERKKLERKMNTWVKIG